MSGPGWKAAVEATLRIAPERRSIMPGRTARHSSIRRADVEVDHLPLPRGVEFGEPAAKPEAGIVDQQLDLLSGGLDLGHQLRRGSRRAEIDGHGARIAKLGGERFEPVLAPRREHQPMAALGQRRANSTPSPADAPVIRAIGLRRSRCPRNGRLDDLARLARRLAVGQRVDMLHAALDLAPDGILVVEEAWRRRGR